MRWPRQRIVVALLAVSVALNLFFLAGAAWTRLHPFASGPEWQRPYRHIAAQLDLNPQQHAKFQQYVVDMHARSLEMRQGIAPLITSAWDELARPQADQTLVMQRFDAASQKWREFERQSMARTLDFLADLSPAQRSKFVELVNARRAERFRRHR